MERQKAEEAAEQKQSKLEDMEKKMQVTLKEILVNAKETTDDWGLGPDNPRELWLDGYCA